MKKNALKSIGAIASGFIIVFVLSIITDFALQKLGVFPPQTDANSYTWWMLVLALFYKTIYTAVGGFAAAALAPTKPMRHAIIIGVLGIIISTLGTIANWDKTSPATAWYPVLLILLTLPSVLFGGKLKTNEHFFMMISLKNEFYAGCKTK